MAGVKRKIVTDSDKCEPHVELDEVVCPICLEHPHNAVLLLCSSHDKGCKAYICDTSYRHSNCLDRYKKLAAMSTCVPVSHVDASRDTSIDSDMRLALQSNPTERDQIDAMDEISRRAFDRFHERSESGTQNLHRHLDPHGEGFFEIGDSVFFRERVEIEEIDQEDGSSESKAKLKCPLCRGDVLGWEHVGETRKYLNMKKRSCSGESCLFVGNYSELRKHARMVHPTERPSDVDPSREQVWRHLERQREHSDIVTAVQSIVPGAVVVGDYAIENGDGALIERENDGNAPLLATLFLFEMIGSMDQLSELRSRPRLLSRQRPPLSTERERRYLWGENLLGLQDESDNEEDLRVFPDVDDESPLHRTRRRRLVQSRTGEEQQQL